MSELATLKEIKSYYGKGAKAEDDDELEAIRDRISKIFETYCDRIFDTATYIEDYDGGNRNCIYLKHYPVTSITSVYDDSEWGWGEDYLTASGTYKIKDNRAIVLKEGYVFYDYEQNVRITYVAGYSTMPADLKHACIIEVIRAFKSRHEPDVVSRSIGDGSISYTDKGFLPMTLEILDKYMYRGIA